MPTPTTAFADAAAKFGDVDPNDIEAVERWFMHELPKLPEALIEQVLQDLLAKDGTPEHRELIRVYPERVSLPSLGASPEVLAPLLAEDWRTLIRRLLRGPGKR